MKLSSDSQIKLGYLLLSIHVVLISVFNYYYFTNYVNKRIVFALKKEDRVILAVNDLYSEPGYIATLNGKDLSDKVIVTSNVDTTKKGSYEITYTLKYPLFNIERDIVRKIYVSDLESPLLSVNSDDKIYLFLNEKFSIPSAVAMDNIDGDITKNIRVETNVNTKFAGKYNLTYKVKDSSNNESSKVLTVVVDKKKNLSKIEIKINEQKLYYYEKNKLVLKSDVVTGNSGTSPTPVGKYKVLSKTKDAILRGKNYTSYVEYWIAFIGSSYGMHDAPWRSNFGGSIYRGNGSHGCVNMPLKKVQKLYEKVVVGTPVYVKKS